MELKIDRNSMHVYTHYDAMHISGILTRNHFINYLYIHIVLYNIILGISVPYIHLHIECFFCTKSTLWYAAQGYHLFSPSKKSCGV